MADRRRSIWRMDDSFRRRLVFELTLAELATLLMSRELLGPVGAVVAGAHMKQTEAASRSDLVDGRIPPCQRS
jgi:hypothetical protein